MNILLELFVVFAKIGLFTFGGGYAMISMIEHHCVETKKWISHEEMMNITVIAESTPGPIAINCATYTGYKKAGLIGSIIATLAMIVPSFIIIYLISIFLDNLFDYTIITYAFNGIKIAVSILILDAGITMIKKMHKKRLPRLIMISACISTLLINIFTLNISSIYLMFISAIISLSIFIYNDRSHKQGGECR